MIGVDFDGIFVEDIPNIKMTDEEYIEFIKTRRILKLNPKLLEIMKNNNWVIITGRKQYLEEVTKSQLEWFDLTNLKWIYFKNTNIQTWHYKVNTCMTLDIEFFIESDSYQTKNINKFIKCIQYQIN